MKFDREPIKKTEIDKAMDAYEKHFGEPYVLQWGFAGDTKEVIAEINRLIAADTKQELKKYDKGLIY